MSDDEAVVVEKRGRGRPKSNGNTPAAEPKVDSKKRGRPPGATKPAKETEKSSDDEEAPVVKRGRGRPKGTKKKVPARGKTAATPESKGRGRGRKEAAPPKKDASSDEEQDEDEEEEGSDE